MVRLDGDAPTLASAEGLKKSRKSSHADFMKIPKKTSPNISDPGVSGMDALHSSPRFLSEGN